MATYIQLGMDEVLQMQRQADAENYQAFEDKFKPKKTTDDCYTPDNIYEAVAEWVSKEYGIARAQMLRPFWPGKDYQEMAYPGGCCVVDNPPFSILASIINFYAKNSIRFFLFAPALTLFSGRNADVSYLPIGAGITYENGAEVRTSFVTNLDPWKVRTAPELYQAIEKVNKENIKKDKKELPKYSYPDYVITAATVQRWCHYGIDYRLAREDCTRIGELDSMKAVGKSIFGGGYLLSERAAAERAAAERAAAERAAAHRWTISEREMGIIRSLGSKPV